MIIVVIDGIRAMDSFGNGDSTLTGGSPREILPKSWDTIVPNSVRATAAYNLGATITAPAHCAMATGRRLPLGHYDIIDEPGLYRPELPTVMETLRDAGLSRNQVVVMGNSSALKPMAHSVWPVDGGGLPEGADFEYVTDPADPTKPGTDDAAVVSQAMARLGSADPPRFMLINLHQTDRSAHFGSSGEYEADLRAMDKPLVDLWSYIDRKSWLRDHTHVFIVADHGRHVEAESNPPWKHHGDHCLGCRNVPLLASGPGIRAGEVVNTAIQLVDLGPTAAEILGAKMPYADGRVATELFHSDVPPGRSGVSSWAEAGGATATIHYLSGSERRSELELDGVIVSDPEAVAVEGLATTRGNATWVCWREFMVLPDEEIATWIPRCMEDRGDGFVDIRAPEFSVGPFWNAAMTVDSGGSLVLGYAYNPNGIVREGLAGDTVGVRLAHYDGAGWSITDMPTETLGFPNHAALAFDPADGRGFMAIGASPRSDDGRYFRQIWFAEAPVTRGGPITAFNEAPLGLEEWRLERPALDYTDSVVHLAAIAVEEFGTALMVTSSSDRGASWSTPVLVRPDSPVMPHLPPVWADGRVYVATVPGDDQEAEVCSVEPDGTDLLCEGVGSPRINQVNASGDSLLLLVDADVGAWQPARRDLDRL